MIKVFKDENKLSRAAADFFVDCAKKSINEKGKFSVVLSGGSSPKQTYELLASKDYINKVEWSKVHVFWGDERYVPKDDSRSNSKMAIDTFLSKVQIPNEQINSILYSVSPEASAIQYQNVLIDFFNHDDPSFDLIFLGLGENGHTASLFPHTSVLNNKEWIKEVFVEEQDMYRITMTSTLINKAANIVFLVFGKDKSKTVSEVIEGEYQPDTLPAQLIKPEKGNLYWYLDKKAASDLKNS